MVSAYESVADQSGVFLRFLRVGGGLVFCMGPVLALRMAGRGRLDTSRLASRAAYPATSRLEQPPVVASAPSCFSASACRVERDRGAFHYVREQRIRPDGKSPDRRKLIAVVYADMVGYSRLIGLDDAGTLERLRSLRRNLIDPAIEEHGGRIVQTGGDSLLIVFDSIDGAVRCAVEGAAAGSDP